MSVNIAIFASGAGSNARKIIEYLRRPLPPLRPGQPGGPLHPARAGERGAEDDNHVLAPGKIKISQNQPSRNIRVALIACNKPGAGVLDIAHEFNIPSILLDKEKFFRGNAYVDELKQAHINIIVLAGFLWKVPAQLINAFQGRIINIHPALLPKYGGKGMYGHFVHEAVIASGDKESGITIHLVDELFDHGQAIFQAYCPVLPGDTPDTLAKRIHALEHANYPRVIEEFAKNSQ